MQLWAFGSLCLLKFMYLRLFFTTQHGPMQQPWSWDGRRGREGEMVAEWRRMGKKNGPYHEVAWMRGEEREECWMGGEGDTIGQLNITYRVYTLTISSCSSCCFVANLILRTFSLRVNSSTCCCSLLSDSLSFATSSAPEESNTESR